MIPPVRSLAVLATLLLAAGPALAQPGAALPAPPGGPGGPGSPASDDEAPAPPPGGVLVGPVVAPPGGPEQPAQNEDWANVSHINGQVVKVGERGDYLYRWKTTNIASNPIGWLIGFYGLSVSRAVHDNVAIRADANLFMLVGSSEHGYELGVSAPIYFRRVFSGPFLEPGVIVRSLSRACDSCDTVGKPSIGPEILFGWHWTFDSGLNIAMAAGAMRNLNDRGGSGLEPAGYFRIGYAF